MSAVEPGLPLLQAHGALTLREHWGEPGLPAVSARVRLVLGRGRLTAAWEVSGPSRRSRPPTPPGWTDGLWEHDVVELFLRSQQDGEHGPRYVEIELGVGEHWLALAFDGVRQRSAELRNFALVTFSSVTEPAWQGRAEIRERGLVDILGPPPWTGAVTALLTDPASGRRRYLAWPDLPGETPDFHQPQAWAPIELCRS